MPTTHKKANTAKQTRGHGTNLGTPHGVVFRFRWEPEVGSLPCAEGLGLVIIHFRWPRERHLHDVKYCSIPWRRWNPWEVCVLKQQTTFPHWTRTKERNLHVGADIVAIDRPIRRSAVNTCLVVVFVVWQVAVGIVSQTSAAARFAGLVAYPKSRVLRLAIRLPLPTFDAMTHSQIFFHDGIRVLAFGARSDKCRIRQEPFSGFRLIVRPDNVTVFESERKMICGLVLDQICPFFWP